MSPGAIALYHDALEGVNFLHSHGWVHGDLKPGNVGIKGTRAVLLDNGGSWQFDNASLRPPSPGFGGTIPYLAPEREMQGHGSEVDVWSMGIVLFELMYGYHPWKFSSNPWRPGGIYENLRPQFNQKYREAMDQVRRSSDVPQSKLSLYSMIESYISLIVNFTVRDLLLHMLRHQWADEHQASPRTSIKDALNHPCWQFFEETGYTTKRMRSS